jgi:hypothetical protein
MTMQPAKYVFASHGSRVSIKTNLPRLEDVLFGCAPPQTQLVEGVTADEEFNLLADGEVNDRTYTLHRGPELLINTKELARALGALASEWHAAIALHASPLLFVHAGVVGWLGKAIVIPGRSRSGKTSMVAALVRAGADYYSDEYAVFDEFGYVHPYPKPLSLREHPGTLARQCNVTELGGRNGQKPIPVGLVVATRYDEHVRWESRALTAGQTVLWLLDNTICARTRTRHAIEVFARIASGSLAVGGDRPDCDQVVPSLLSLTQAKTDIAFLNNRRKEARAAPYSFRSSKPSRGGNREAGI